MDGWVFGCIGDVPSHLDLAGIRGIAPTAFQGCSTITSLKIPEGVVSIGNMAFVSCSSLVSVQIPDSVKCIYTGAFSFCNSELYDLTTIPGVKLVDGWVVGYTDSLSGDLDITSARGVANYAFCLCSNLTSVTMPISATCVGQQAFFMCGNLESITISEDVTSIGDHAFYECTNLTHLEFKGNAPVVGENTFEGVPSSCVVKVPQGSTGWGVEIPGTWQGMRIEYSTKRPDGGPYTEIVDGIEWTFSVVEGEATISSIPKPTSGAVNVPSELGGRTVVAVGDAAFAGCQLITSLNIASTVRPRIWK